MRVGGGPAWAELTNNINYVEATNKDCDIIGMAAKAPYVGVIIWRDDNGGGRNIIFRGT
jgi:hypothetical protein